jgi:hypothetical protein
MGHRSCQGDYDLKIPDIAIAFALRIALQKFLSEI